MREPVPIEQGAELAVVGGEVGAHEHRIGVVAKPDRGGDRRARDRVIAGEHRHLDARPPTGGERWCHSIARRVVERHQPAQLEFDLGLLGRRW
ncbi:MAG: hypothetical protein FD127_3553 [Acidimicrobiaceae bacterium]|nr:MAG: hypothetical protein FD127_3553 [Acidimicrobiaceae bacterium]